MRNAGLDELQAGIKTVGRNINNLRYVNDATLMAEKRRGTKELFDEGEEAERVSLKLNIEKPKIMVSGPINSWQIDGETMATVTNFILEAPKSLRMVTVAMKSKDGCSLEEKL